MSNFAGRDEAAEYALALQELMAHIKDEVARQLRAGYVDLGRATGTIPRGNLPSGGNTGTGYTPGDGSVTTAKIADGAVSVAKLGFDPATQSELNDHAATRGAGDFGHVKPDGSTIVSAGGVLSVSGSAIGSTTLLGLSDVPDSYSGSGGAVVQVKSDATGVEFVRRTHTIKLVEPGADSSRTWANIPATKTEIFGVTQHRMKQELASFTEARLQARIGVTGPSGSTIRAEYSADGVTWNYLDDTAGPSVLIDTTAPTLAVGSWATLSAAARTGDVWLRLVGVGGDGAADPTIGQIWLQLR